MSFAQYQLEPKSKTRTAVRFPHLDPDQSNLMSSRKQFLLVVAILGAGALAYDFINATPMPPPPSAAPLPLVVSSVVVPREDFFPPPLEERDLPLPEPGDPTPPETDPYCDNANRQHGNVIVDRIGQDKFAVDEVTWNKATTSTRADLASWMSQCQYTGAPIEIVSATTKERLATYDIAAGLRTHEH